MPNFKDSKVISMTDWVKCTDTSDRPIFLNLTAAMIVFWSDFEKSTLVSFPGGDGQELRIQEKPESILSAREPDS